MYYPYEKNSEKNVDQEDIEDIAKTLREEGNEKIQSDVNGSYTGMTNDDEIPVQDADDL